MSGIHLKHFMDFKLLFDLILARIKSNEFKLPIVNRFVSQLMEIDNIEKDYRDRNLNRN